MTGQKDKTHHDKHGGFKRLMRLSLQFLGVLIVGCVIIGCFFAWRLASAPISLTFLNTYFEQALSPKDGPYKVSVGDTILKWIRIEHSLDLQLSGTRILGRGGEVIAIVPELSVSLRALPLLRGEISPESLSITGLKISVVRKFDGTLGFNVPGVKKFSHDFVANFMKTLLDLPRADSSLGELSQVEFINASIKLDDSKSGTVWNAPNVNATIYKGQDGATGVAEFYLKLGQTSTKFNFRGSSNSANSKISLDISFANLIPSEIARVSDRFSAFDGLQVPTSGTLSTKFSSDGLVELLAFDINLDSGIININKPAEFSLSLVSGRVAGVVNNAKSLIDIEQCDLNLGRDGKLHFPASINHSVPLQKISFSARYLLDEKRLVIEEALLDLAGPTMSMRGKIQELAENIMFEIEGNLTDLSIVSIKNYWPKKLEPSARAWIVDRLVLGEVPSGKFRLNGKWLNSGAIQLGGFSGELPFEDLTIDYPPSIRAARKVSGRVKFNTRIIEIFVDDAVIEGLSSAEGKMLITGLDQVEQTAKINLVLGGSIKSFLDLFVDKYSKLTDAIDINTYNLAGFGSSEVKLQFPIRPKLTLAQVKFSIDSILHDVSISNVAFEKTLTHGDLVLTANNKNLVAEGTAKLDGVPFKLKWEQSFNDNEQIQARYDLSSRLDVLKLHKFLGVPPISSGRTTYLSGVVGFKATANIMKEGTGTLSSTADLTDVGVVLPEFAWVKPPKVKAQARVFVQFSKGGIAEIPLIEITGGGMAVLGNAQFRKNKFHEAKFSKVELGDNRIVGSILREGEELQIDVKGSLLDLTALLELEEPEQSKYKRGTPFKLNLALDNVEITRGRFLRNVTSTFFNDGLVWSNIALASNIDGDKEFSIEFFPSEGKRFLRVKSNDAGEMLRIFDIYEDMSGGQLDMTAQFEDMSVDSKVTGKGVIKDFRLVDAPILARLLSIASITGIPDQLGAGGITFQKFNAPFVLNDGLLEVREAKASGLSLGITASGVFDLESETIDIKGSLAPLDTVNSLLGEIPVVGRLFSGGEKGGSVFAAEYTMSGPTDDPEIKTNPLSALTPGIFRKLFNILPGVGLGKKTPIWADPGDIN